MENNYDELKDKHETLANKIFTTFTKPEELEITVDKVKSNYSILFSKIFVFSSPETEELICTYNIDYNNCNASHIIENTVLLHRKKVTKTLYSINAINALNKDKEPGYHEIDWEKYRESILLTRKGVFTQLKTKLYDIIILQEK